MNGDTYDRKPNGQFENGNKGGPGGRKAGGSLSGKLRQEAARVVVLPDGTRRGNRAIVAETVWHGLTHGVLLFPDGAKIRLNANQYIELFEMVRDTIGEKPATEIGNADGQPFSVVFAGLREGDV